MSSGRKRTRTNEVAIKNNITISRTNFFCLFALTLLAGAGAGVYRQEIYATVAPIFGVKVSADTLDTTLLQQTYRELLANYDGEVDKTKLSQGAARGMVAAAGDKYTTFFDADEATQFDDEMSGAIGGGVGAQIGLRNDVVTLVKILKDTPGERAGLKAGDQVLAINDESTDGFTVDTAVSKIRGEVGTTVRLRIQRGDETKEITVTREEIVAPSVESEIRDNIGILTVTRFDKTAAQLARQAAVRFKEANVKAVILDLRGNPGGYVDAAQNLAGIWLSDKLVVTEKEGSKVVDELRTGSNPVLEGVTTIVLVDEGSASASEIVAGAFRDHKVATLLGQTTYGKGSVQRLISLADGTLLKVTVARWYTPSGNNITEDGIKPDVEVNVTTEQLRAGDDVQLNEAIKRLQ